MLVGLAQGYPCPGDIVTRLEHQETTLCQVIALFRDDTGAVKCSPVVPRFPNCIPEFPSVSSIPC